MARRLGLQDLKTLQSCTAELYAIGDLATFGGRVISVLSTAVPGDLTVYAQMDLRRGTISWNPEATAAIGLSDGPQIYASHIGDMPMVKSYRRGDGSAVKISDFVTQREFRGTALYNEFYRPAGLEYHMAKGLPGPTELVTAIGILRKRRDFSERDRLLLNLLRPHLNQSYLNAVTVTRMEQDLALMRQGIDALAEGVVSMTRDGRVVLMTSRARAWIAEYWGPTRQGAAPDDLRRWFRLCEEQLDADGDAPLAPAPLLIQRTGRRLTVRLVCDGDHRLLLFSEHVSERHPERLEALGLSRREAEVLAWVAEGKTNADVATILGASTRTIDKHLQHIFGKLGVETRTAAAARALSVLRD